MIKKTLIALILVSVNFAFPPETIEKNFEVASGEKLDMDLMTGGSIDITGWDEEQASVLVHLDGRDCQECKVDFDETSFGLSIDSHYDGRRFNRDCDLQFEIHVPARFDLAVKTMGGEIIIDRVEGEITGETMGGELKLTNLRGELNLTTMGGNISLKNSDVDGRLKTMGGNVLFRDVTGDVKGSTMGGNITYKNVFQRNGEEVHVSTMGGNISIDSRGGKVRAKTWGGNIAAAGDEVHVTTMGGDITVRDAPLGADVHTMGGDIDIHSAREYVKAKTMGGDIDIGAIDGWIRATTMGGDISVTMIGSPDERKRDVELESMGGDISLAVPPGLSMDFDIELAYTRNSRQNYGIVSDFDIQLEETDQWERTYFIGTPRKYIYGTGVVAGGKNKIKIKTINGNIHIRKGD